MKNHYPAIDVLASISRLMNELVDDSHKSVATKMRSLLSVYYENVDLISIGAYRAGANPELDQAVGLIDGVNGFLMQGVGEKFGYEETLRLMEQSVAGGKS
jgi:flagellum-specific ATP synthase